MKYCPACNADYSDDTLKFCLQDGTPLGERADRRTGAFNHSEAETAYIPGRPTQGWDQPKPTANISQDAAASPRPKKFYTGILVGLLAIVLLILVGIGVVGWSFYSRWKNIVQVENFDSPTPASNTRTVDAPPVSNGDSTLSLAKYNQISNGMSYRQVVAILGSGGVEQMRSGTGKYEVVSYKWEGDNYKFVTVIFLGDKVNSKVQYGLK